MSRARVGAIAFVLCAVVALAVTPASAAPKSKSKRVTITTEPAGAQVYLNLKEDGPVCTTPCAVTVPVGSTPIIIELENYQSLIEDLSVEKQEKQPRRTYKLEAAVGVILVKGPRGAVIRVNDAEWSSKAPARIEIEPGDHVVVLEVNGKQVFMDSVTVEHGAEVEVAAPGAGGGSDPDIESPGALDPALGGAGVRDQGAPGTPAPPRGSPIVTVQLAMDVGFRAFRYEMPGPGLAPENEGGQVLVGPIVELYPGTLLGVRALRGFALVAHYGYGVSSHPVTDADGQALDASTYWASMGISARQRWTLGGKATVEVGGGYVRDLHRFEGDEMEIRNVPDAEYGAVRLGARLSLLLGALEPYLAGENRIVLDGGPLADRFSNPSANGVRGAVGASMRVGAVDLRLEGSLARYSWTFSPGDTFSATGATDTITKITAAVGYSY